MSNKFYNVGIYSRISREDNETSIENQIFMLEKVIDMMPNWEKYRIYIDEGVSGGNFKRKGFLDMIEDVRSGFVNLVLVKDLSRFGRNYLEAGRYLEEELPAFGCRFVAITDNIDTANDENDIITFLNVINDFYLRDVSGRIKSAFIAKAKEGHKLTGAAPYGYIRKSNERSRLAIDEYAAGVVKHIFQLRVEGFGYTKIASVLNNEGILSPREYYFHSQDKIINIKDNSTSSCSKLWSIRTIKLILNNEIYIGNTVSLKRGTRSYRDSSEYKRNESDWIRVENTHIPIVETEIWDKVQVINKVAREKVIHSEKPTPSLFSGLLICQGCNGKMIFHKRGYYCSAYIRSGKTFCSSHYISEKNLKEIVISYIKRILEKIALNENALVENVKTKLIKGYKERMITFIKKRRALEQAIYSLELQIDQLYEDRVERIISAQTFTSIANNIESKRVDVEEELKNLNQVSREEMTRLKNADKWTEFIKEKSTYP